MKVWEPWGFLCDIETAAVRIEKKTQEQAWLSLWFIHLRVPASERQDVCLMQKCPEPNIKSHIHFNILCRLVNQECSMKAKEDDSKGARELQSFHNVDTICRVRKLFHPISHTEKSRRLHSDDFNILPKLIYLPTHAWVKPFDPGPILFLLPHVGSVSQWWGVSPGFLPLPALYFVHWCGLDTNKLNSNPTIY